MERLAQLDIAAFRWINGHHSAALDWVMWAVSQHWAWAVVLAAMFALVVLRHDSRRWWLVAIGFVLCFLLADQGSVHLFKEQFHRLRPCHALEDVRMFHTRCGGLYGFVSSHAANAFAIAVFMAARYRRLPAAGWLALLWAATTSYSRAYLGKHYPGDLLCGALFGAAIGLIVCWLTATAEKKAFKTGTK
ncbi:MAG: phosphatase PAP2 family protein [Bacteroidales bacterium]|nr:phosphatase PAP2 family protein [Bacteroidales bacterium]